MKTLSSKALKLMAIAGISTKEEANARGPHRLLIYNGFGLKTVREIMAWSEYEKHIENREIEHECQVCKSYLERYGYTVTKGGKP